MIPIFVVDRQEMPRLFIELSPAFGTDEAVYFKRLFSVITRRGAGLLQFSHDIFHRFLAVFLLWHSFREISMSVMSHRVLYGLLRRYARKRRSPSLTPRL